MFDADDFSPAEIHLGACVGGGGGHRLKVVDSVLTLTRRVYTSEVHTVDMANELDGKVVELNLLNGMNVYCESGGWTYACMKDEGQNTEPDVNQWKITKVHGRKNLIELELASGKWQGRNWYVNNGEWGSCEMRNTCTNTENWKR